MALVLIVLTLFFYYTIQILIYENCEKNCTNDRTALHDFVAFDLCCHSQISFIYHISSNTAWVSNWTRVNLPIQIERFTSFFKSRFQPSLDLNLGDYRPMKLIKPRV